MSKLTLSYVAPAELGVEWPLLEALGQAFNLSFGTIRTSGSGFNPLAAVCIALDGRGLSPSALKDAITTVCLANIATPVALLNADADFVKANRLALRGIKGVFLPGTSPRAIVHGLLGITEGLECWPTSLDSPLSLQIIDEPDAGVVEGLTKREVQIIDLLVAGRSNDDIAHKLGISMHTVKVHLYRAYKKLNVKNRFEAYALMRGDKKTLRLGIQKVSCGLFALLFLASLTAFGQNLESAQALKSPQEQLCTGQVEDEVGCLILNRTITVLGQVFYEEFNAFWRLNFAEENSNLAIYKRPTARFGSEIWVDYRGRNVVRQLVF